MYQSSQFLSLPIELISSTLGFLDELDLLTCTVVAKQLRNLIADSSRFQYTIELAKRRMTSVIPPSVTLPYASRLNFLRTREQAWRTLDWKSEHRLKIPPSGSMYEFVDGLYATGEEDDTQVTRSISFWELPTSENPGDNAQLRSWTHLMKDITIIDFTMDPAQDLLVLVALAPTSSTYLYEIHLRSITTNEIHPKALIPKLSCLSESAGVPFIASFPTTSVNIQIFGDLVALLVKSDFSSHLEIWDWVKNPQVSCKMKSKSGIEDFTFISSDAFLIVRTTGSLKTYTFPNPITNSSAPIGQYDYMFPELSDGFMYWYMTISRNSPPALIPQSGPNRDRRKQLYSPKPTERIYVCTLCIFSSSGTLVFPFLFFFNPQILLNPPEEWKKATRQVIRRIASCHCVPLSPTIPTQPLSFASPPIPQPHTDTSVQPPHTLASPASTNTTPSSSSSLSQSSTLPDPTIPIPSAQSKPPPKVPHIPIVIPWNVWGPQSTRWFDEHINTDWQNSAYGLRIVDSLKVDSVAFSAGWKGGENGDRDGDDEGQETGGSTTGEGGVEGSSSSNPTFAHDDTEHDDSESSIAPRFLRLRDYNPYSIRECLQAEESERRQGRNDKRKAKSSWRGPRVVSEPTTTDVKGVFKHDVVSRLPYVEVLSEETFRVTDVMMDGCRLLLHKRGENGTLRQVDVLTL